MGERKSRVESVPLNRISIQADPARTEMNPRALQELETSIRSVGVLQHPKIVLRGRDDSGQPVYDVVYGHRRLMAALNAGLLEVECIVEDDSDKTNKPRFALEALMENVIREDLSSLDRALSYRAILDLTGWTLIELGKQGVGSHGTIVEYLRLLDLPEDIRGLTGSGDPKFTGKPLTVGHVSAAVKAGDFMHDVLRKAAREGLSRKQTRLVASAVAEAIDPRRIYDLLNKHAFSASIHSPAIEKDRSQAILQKRARDYATKHEEPVRAPFDGNPQVDAVLERLRGLRVGLADLRGSAAVRHVPGELHGKIAEALEAFADEVAAWAADFRP